MQLRAINYLSSSSLACEKTKKGKKRIRNALFLLSVWNGLVPLSRSAELQGNFITRSSTSLKVATEQRSRTGHYPFLPVGRKRLGVPGHIWSFAAQGQINKSVHGAFHSFLQIFSKCWMKRLWFSTHLMDRWRAPDGSCILFRPQEPKSFSMVRLWNVKIQMFKKIMKSWPSIWRSCSILFNGYVSKIRCFSQKGRNSSWSGRRNPAQDVFRLRWFSHHFLASEPFGVMTMIQFVRIGKLYLSRRKLLRKITQRTHNAT